MAIWRAYGRSDGRLALRYINADGSQPLGVVRADTPEDMLISWCLDLGRAVAGDVIDLPTRYLMIVRGESDSSH